MFKIIKTIYFNNINRIYRYYVIFSFFVLHRVDIVISIYQSLLFMIINESINVDNFDIINYICLQQYKRDSNDSK